MLEGTPRGPADPGTIALEAWKRPPAARPSYLDEACGGDSSLRSLAEEILSSFERDGGEGLAFDPSATTRALLPSEGPGTAIGRYKLLEEIGEGGFGVVFLAEQRQPVRRTVALKILKPGMDTKQVIARFEAERQALALMDHPNIARVYDAGATDSGRPYFVMELVRGIPITDYCDQNRLTTRERLKLFIQVCHAVQHAHQKGIIHRDLKPSNVLVSLQDSSPEPKVIDFGVAKAISQRLTELTLHTGLAQVIGTPLYMSPEQAELSGLDVDTRADIYSLGVLLYELLTGSTPFEKHRLLGAGFDELRRAIREEEPPRPSLRLSTLGAAELTTVAARRQTDTRKLRDLLRGDLDWVAMKALSKDRTRRYDSASAFAADVQRFLDDAPVEARPPSTWYRFRKFARRKKLLLAAGLAVSASVVLVLAGALLYALEQRKLAGEKAQLAIDRELARMDAEAKLHDALLGRAEALRVAGEPGYRAKVWDLLHQARALDVPEKDPRRFREQILFSLADPMGLSPVDSPRATRNPPSPPFIELYDKASEPLRRVLDEIGPRVLWSPDRKWVAALRGSDPEGTVTVTLWDGEGKELGRIRPILGGIASMAFSPDSRLLVLGCSAGTEVWAVPAIDLRTRLRGGVGDQVALHPGNDLLVTFSFRAQPRVQLWSIASGLKLASIPAPLEVSRLEFSAEGDLLLGLSGDRSQVLLGWYVERTPEKLHLAGHGEGVPGVAFSPDGKTLASASHDRTLRIWDVETGRLLRTSGGYGNKLQTVVFSSDGNLLAGGERSGFIQIWNPATGEALCSFQNPGAIWQVRFEEAGRYLAAGGDNGVVLWELKKNGGEVEAHPFKVFPRMLVWDLALAPEGSHLAILSNNPPGLFWCDLTREEPPRRLDLPVRSWDHAIYTMSFDRPGRQLFFVTRDKGIGSWEPPDGPVRERNAAVAGWGPCVTGDGRFAAYPNQWGGMNVHDLELDREIYALAPEASQIWSFDWSPGGDRLAVGLTHGGVAIWNLEQVRTRLAEFGFEVRSTVVDRAAISPPPPASDTVFQEMLRTADKAAGEVVELDKLPREPTSRPPPGDAKNSLAWLLATSPEERLRNPSRAVKLAEEAVALSPQVGSFWNTLGVARYRTGNLAAAREAFEKSLRLSKGSEAFDWFFLAMIHWREGREDEARQWLQKAVEWTDKNARGNAELIRFRVEANDVMGLRP